MQVYFYGSVKRRGFRLTSGHEAEVTLSATMLPPTSHVEPPAELRGSARVEHDEPMPAQFQLWSSEGTADDGVDAVAILASTGDAENRDGRCIARYDVQIVAESATRKQADSHGGEVVEYRVTIRFDFPSNAPFNATLAGRLASQRKATIAIVLRQGDLFERAERATLRRDDDEPGLPFED